MGAHHPRHSHRAASLSPQERRLHRWMLGAIAPLAFATVEVDAGAARDIGYGRALPLAVPADPTALVHDGRLLALYRPAASGSEPVAVLA